MEAVTIASYVISDIHGEYDRFMELLEIIGLKETDTLYILGDVFDRGPHPIKTMLKLMGMSNVVCILGNHEYMALDCLALFCIGKGEELEIEVDWRIVDQLFNWQMNGSKTTIDEFLELDLEKKKEIVEFIRGFPTYQEVSAGGKDYLLVHAGLGDFSPEKKLEDYTVKELVWHRPDYGVGYFEDVYTVTGHTPTQLIKGNPKPGYIYRANHHIAIDCGSCFPKGRLAAICLDTGEEFYSSQNMK